MVGDNRRVPEPIPPPDKSSLRRELTAARRSRTDAAIEHARAAVAATVLRRWARQRWRCVAGYVPLRTEPGSVQLLDGLRERGVRVLVPVLLPDRDLDWSPWGGPGDPGQPLGVGALAEADAVLVPALAVARDGTRLGRGGGSYDRALSRVRPGAVLAALLFDGELVDELPADPWDVPVSAVVTPAGWAGLVRAGQDSPGPRLDAE